MALETMKVDLGSLESSFRVAFCRALGLEGLSFKMYERANGSLAYELRGPGLSSAHAGYSYKVLPYLYGEDAGAWLAFTYQCRYEQGEPYMASVSMLLFVGLATDTMKIPILRAEWDAPDVSNSVRDAQPHWHVYLDASGPSHRITAFPPVEDDFLDTSSEGSGLSWLEEEEAASRAMNMHLPMAARWDSGGPNAHHSNEMTPDQLPAWFAAVADYLKAQVKHALSR